ncbi:MAG: transcriptional [Geobacteraceae bacterium]|nr:MAG: transcriptional [Geobacteraceae bacterium]
MNTKKRIFISSVQKELELERAAVAGLISTDPFLHQHCTAVLFEKEPPPPHPASRPYLESLRGCAVYVLLIANEYGHPDGDISATHHEYRLAQELQLPTIVFIKGATDAGRSEETHELIKEIKRAGHTYKRFHDREDLKPEMLRALMRTLADEFGLQATGAEVDEGEHQIEAASAFETAVLSDVTVASLDQDLIAAFNQRVNAGETDHAGLSAAEALHARGLAIRGDAPDIFLTTAAAFVLFGTHPAHRYPQCEILVDAYDEIRITGRPKGQFNINAPLPHALEQVLKFIDDHTFHPRRVVGLNNIRLDEYPVAALREALLNAVAHRSYDDAARKVFAHIFRDRIEIASPGYPLKPLTLAKLRKGGYRPCSRNPLIAQTLATLDKMEQRGSGIARMRDAMLDHGLNEPKLDQQDGFFVVTLPGPDGNYDRIKTPTTVAGSITPAIEARLNERQQKMVTLLVTGEALTSRRCESEFGITRDTAARDFALLLELGIAEKQGKGRSIRYVLAQPLIVR